MRSSIRYAITGGYLFVYGTLMRDEEAHAKMDGCTFVGNMRTAPRYHLVQLVSLGEGYFGLEHGGTEQVLGELYQVPPEKLAELDKWEENYVRDYVMLEDGRIADAYFPQVLRPSRP